VKKIIAGGTAAIALVTTGALFTQGLMTGATAAMPAAPDSAVQASITAQVQASSDAEAARLAAEEAARLAAEQEAARRAAEQAAARKAAQQQAPRPSSSSPSRPTTNVSGIQDSAYTGAYYNAAHEATRKCIVKKESSGNYGVVGAGRYHGAYQFAVGTSNSAATKMGRGDLVGVPASKWTRAEQDEAFWVTWNNGAGRGNWPTARGC
jgi:hypothetical protein